MPLKFSHPAFSIDWKAVVVEFIGAVSHSECQAHLAAFAYTTIEAICTSLAKIELDLDLDLFQ